MNLSVHPKEKESILGVKVREFSTFATLEITFSNTDCINLFTSLDELEGLGLDILEQVAALKDAKKAQL